MWTWCPGAVCGLCVCVGGGDPGSEDWTLKLQVQPSNTSCLWPRLLSVSFTQFRENNTPLPPLRPSLRVPPPLNAQSPGWGMGEKGGGRVEDEGGGVREEGEGRGWVKKACVMPSKKDNIRHRC